MSFSPAPVLALAIFVVAFWFIATERADKVKTVLVAAGLMALLGLIPGEQVFYSSMRASTGTSSSCCSG